MDSKDQLSRIYEALTRIDVTLERQSAILAEHVRRTEANEAALEHIRAELHPLARAAVTWPALAKIISALGTMLTLVAGLLKMTGHLH